MNMTFTLTGDARVDGQVGPFVIHTDQPPDSTAPTPFQLFLASIGACAGFYVSSFCRARGIETSEIRIVQRNNKADGMVTSVDLEIELPDSFPDRYRDALLRAADHCTVKRHLEHPPTVALRTTSAVPLGAS
jgi:ribosomal protein S12 methylthiotransferase accessory factor